MINKKTIILAFLMLICSTSFIERERTFWLVEYYSQAKDSEGRSINYWGGEIIEASTKAQAVVIFKEYCKRYKMSNLIERSTGFGYALNKVTEETILKK